ncbi:MULTISPECIES: hypothetical protein [Providencia]|uniref:Uncharacterized protein n=1 Tax=Providencia huaxiensis TaxID=2027290 RepID=A0ABU2ITE4_9GAMM|nr:MULTISPECIES: hypothetical protein [Providencia]MBZ3681036.1 hypothetical protein [Providencia rettgeri]AXH63128.1 hypothetical protein CYG50_14460 [Providencia huaxiensis]MDT0132074.1 hypothetical protein [Providencia huaxiensis]MDT1978480.1 hypothetical protein [Providencia huaxiensis]QLR01609.1 hypothetical protein H0912_02190 [Providencia rettgeri]
MELNTKVNNIKSSPNYMDNKKITSKNLSFIEGLNIINPLNTGGYKKVNLAIKTCEFYKREQPELSQLPYSQPVGKIKIPYIYQEEYLVSPSNVFKNNITTENNSTKNIKLENTPMKTSNSNAELINTTKKNFLVKDFGINKLKHFFHESIEKIKSTSKIQSLIIKNKTIPRNEDIYHVRFYNNKDANSIIMQKNNKETECIDLEWDSYTEEPSYFLGTLDESAYPSYENLNFGLSHDSFKKILHLTNFHSSNESLNSNSSGYQSDSNPSLGNSVCFSDDFPHQEKNKNIRLISENFSNLNKNEITDNKANETRLPKKEKNRIARKLKQTQAEKMDKLAKGNSSTGYIHPSRRNKINNSIKIEKINHLDRQIAGLKALKREYQEMAVMTSTHEKKIEQLVLEAQQSIVKK